MLLVTMLMLTVGAESSAVARVRVSVAGTGVLGVGPVVSTTQVFGAPGVEASLGVQLFDRLGLIIKGGIGATPLSLMARLGLAADFAITEAVAVGLGLGALAFPGIAPQVSSFGGGWATASVRWARARPGLFVSLECGPGVTLFGRIFGAFAISVGYASW